MTKEERRQFEEVVAENIRLMSLLVCIITRKELAAWTLADAEDESAGFSADLDIDSESLAFGVRHVEDGYEASIVFFDADEDAPAIQRAPGGGAIVNFPEEISVLVPPDLFEEIAAVVGKNTAK